MGYVTGGGPGKFRRKATGPLAKTAKAMVQRKPKSSLQRLREKVERISVNSAGAWLASEMVKDSYLGTRKIVPNLKYLGETLHSKQGQRTSKGERVKTSPKTSMPHSKTEFSNEVMESDFSNNVIHESRDIARPVQIHFKRTSGKKSKIMSQSMKNWPRQTWSFLNSGRENQSTSTQTRNRLSTPIYRLLDKVWYSTCGFNRSGVFWPWFQIENMNSLYLGATRKDLQASMNWGLGCAPSLYDLVHRLNGGSTQGLEPFLIPDGDQNLLLAIRELKKVYHIRNSNSLLPIYCSIYICAPRRDQRRSNSPTSDWWNPYMSGKPSSASPATETIPVMLQDKNYSFEPQMDSANTIPTATNAYYNVTSATEVVAQSTPYLSEQFKERWDVLDVKSVRLLPEQYCSLTLEQIFNQPMNLKRVMPSTLKTAVTGDLYPYTNHNCYFEGISIVPMIKFWGEEVTALDKSPAAVAEQPAILQRGRVGTGPGIVRVNIETDEASYYAPSTRLRDTDPNYVSPIKNWLDEPGFIAVQRGIPGADSHVNVDYATINGFGGNQTKPMRFNPQTGQWDPIPQSEFNNFQIEINTNTQKQLLEPSVFPATP